MNRELLIVINSYREDEPALIVRYVHDILTYHLNRFPDGHIILRTPKGDATYERSPLGGVEFVGSHGPHVDPNEVNAIFIYPNTDEPKGIEHYRVIRGRTHNLNTI